MPTSQLSCVVRPFENSMLLVQCQLVVRPFENSILLVECQLSCPHPNCLLWSDPSKIQYCSINAKYLAWSDPSNIQYSLFDTNWWSDPSKIQYSLLNANPPPPPGKIASEDSDRVDSRPSPKECPR